MRYPQFETITAEIPAYPGVRWSTPDAQPTSGLHEAANDDPARRVGDDRFLVADGPATCLVNLLN